MARYTVRIEERVVYEVCVEADSEDAAGELAEATLLGAEDPNDFFQSVEERDVLSVARA